jgi:hypothetical protein
MQSQQRQSPMTIDTHNDTSTSARGRVTDAESTTIRELAAAGRSAGYIGLHLGRAMGTIKAHGRKLGIEFSASTEP